MNAHHKQRVNQHKLPPASSQYCSSGSLATPSSRAQLHKAVHRLPLGWQLDALIPDLAPDKASTLAAELAEWVQEMGQYYYCPAVNIAALLELDFLGPYVRKGSLVAISVDDRTDDTVCIDGRGRMVLSLAKDTYELLGLPGRPSLFESLGQRFIVEIDLRDPAFLAGKKGFERTRQKLREWPRVTNIFDQLAGTAGPPDASGREFEMIMCWVDELDAPQPMSLPPTFQARQVAPMLSTRVLSNLAIPVPQTIQVTIGQKNKRLKTNRALIDESVDELENLMHMREWIGCTILGGTMKPEGEQRIGRAAVCSWNGFFHPKVLSQIIDKVSSSLAPETFVSLSLRGMPNSPLGHLSSAPPLVSTRKTPRGKTVKRGRGRGEEEEASGEMGWDCVLFKAKEEIEWSLIEMQ